MCVSVKRPVLRYHGGKWRLAPWIISHFPPHRVYVEPYAGAASVLLQKPRCYAEVYNDRWEVVVNVFRVLRDPEQARELERVLRLTPFSRREFDQCGDMHLAQVEDPIERARRTLLRSFAGFGSAATNATYSTGFRGLNNRAHTTPAHDWMRYPDYVVSFVERLRGVVIENRNALDVIRYYDRHDGVLFYVDPPYPHSTRNMERGNAAYAEEMIDDDHRALAGVLRECTGMVVLSGYACDLYDNELYPDWRRVEKPVFADGARAKTEVLWMSPDTPETQATLFTSG